MLGSSAWPRSTWASDPSLGLKNLGHGGATGDFFLLRSQNILLKKKAKIMVGLGAGKGEQKLFCPPGLLGVG